MSFSLDAYRSIIGDLRALQYEFVDFEAVDPGRPHAVLRHDIDLCMDRAVRMAECEAGEGVSATYFVLLATSFYNLFSRIERQRLQRLISLGHEVGLHFDATTYGDDLTKLETAARWEAGVLEDLTSRPVRVISFHRPVPRLIELGTPFAGRRSAYETKFVRDMAYRSDSAGAWSYGHPLDHPCIKARSAIQILTHPVWWVTQGEQGAVPILANLQMDLLKTIDREMAHNLKPWKAHRERDPANSPAPVCDSQKTR